MKNTNKVVVLTAVVLLMIGATPASAALTEVWQGSVSFSSDLEANKNIDLSSFDTTKDGGRTLISVTVELFHSGSVDILIDNDDDVNTPQANTRIMREWAATGPGSISGSGYKSVTSPIVMLGADDGDDDTFDVNLPDGYDFTGATSYTDILAGTFNPVNSAYETSGSGTVTFIVDVLMISNDLQFNVTPDQYQLQVHNSDLTVTAKVTYTYVPEPATMAILGLGGTILLRRRKT